MRRGPLLGGIALLAVGAILAIALVRPGAPPASGTRRLAEGHWVVSRADRDEYLRDPARLNTHLILKPEPGSAPDSVARLLVVHVDPAGPAYAGGLRKGDRILAVDGSPVSTMGRALNLVHEVRVATSLAVRLDRAGTVLELRFDFE